MNGKKKMGRPPKHDDFFYLNILHCHRILTLSEIAALCKVSVRTAARWVARGKKIKAEQENTQIEQSL